LSSVFLQPLPGEQASGGSLYCEPLGAGENYRNLCQVSYGSGSDFLQVTVPVPAPAPVPAPYLNHKKQVLKKNLEKILPF
jgi:hypothetical protein